jgi:hypothetical protein
VWSLRKKSEDRSADAIGAKLIEEARLICADGIASIEAKIEAAKGGEGDFILAGNQWLDEYREQFSRGLKAWESAEERFLLRRIEWEQSAEKAFYEGMETWNAVYARFEDERRKWEEQARFLFLEGEQFFAQASEALNAAIRAVRAEYERDSKIRIDTVSERVGALASMYVLSGSAAEEARKNINFWMGRYREMKPYVILPVDDTELEDWIDSELQRPGGAINASEKMALQELKANLILYKNYSAKAAESRDLLMREQYIFSGDDQGFYPDYYETELLRTEGELEYWKNRTALAEAVAAYAEALDAGRVTASESLEAWEKANAAYIEAAAHYDTAEDLLMKSGAELSAARDALKQAADRMRAADAALENLRKNYEFLIASLGKQGGDNIAGELALLRQQLSIEQELLENFDDESPWGIFLNRAREVEKQQIDEWRRIIIEQLIAGDEDGLESLAVLAMKAAGTGSFSDDPLFDISGMLVEDKIISFEQYNLLVSVINDSFQSRNENLLKLRLAALSLLMEKKSFTDWYYSVRLPNGADPAVQDVGEQLYGDWEKARLELLIARAELELEALNFLKGNPAGKEAAILAALYTGDETNASFDMETLELILGILCLSIEDMYESLLNMSAENEMILAFISGGSFIDNEYGLKIEEIFLHELINREEFCEGLYNACMGFGALSPTYGRESLEFGLVQLKLL